MAGLALPVTKELFYSILIMLSFGPKKCYLQRSEEFGSLNEVVLWKRGDHGVSDYRIPLITSLPDGSLIALAEARKHSSSDSGPKFLAMRQSRDQGVTWTNTTFIEDDQEATDGLNLGSIVVDEITKSVFVMYSFCIHKCKYATTYVIRSDDNGQSWTMPKNISQQLGGLQFAPGPGYGIQKALDPWKGRLIICGHSIGKTEGLYCVASDDHGNSWHRTAELPRTNQFDPNECQMIEQSDGVVLLSARNQQHEECRCRMMAKSYDGCETFAHSDIYYDHTLIDPTVAASLLNWKYTVYFSNPASRTLRVNMTVRVSGDMGETWKGLRPIWQGPSGYSCLSGIPTSQGNDSYIGLAFEKGLISPYESITFVKLRV
ncbi:sialidase-1 [Nematostella vectensis]|uniref:sialidase-1 n=1 Tax=Nematostella vectensis TaxID=45351 RepID=UPI00138F9D5E|nr:sialidase-1 [Nematostella vectensis]